MTTRQLRIGITLNDADKERFVVLAEIEGRKPATLAADILKEYMQGRADDIEAVLTARKDYQKTITNVRNKKAAH